MKIPAGPGVLLLAGLIGACNNSNPGGSGPDGSSSSDMSGVPPAGGDMGMTMQKGDMGSSSSPYLFPAVWVILMENRSKQQLQASHSIPTIKMLASTYAQAGKYSSPLHPSEPNYIEMTCGCDSAHNSLDVTDESAQTLINLNGSVYGDTSLGGQLETAKVPWRAYAQDSSSGSTLAPCPADDTGEYAAKHLPFVYFQDVFGSGTTGSALCQNRVRVFGDFMAKTGDFYTDLNAGTYAYQWITPDLIYDMHDGTDADGDNFIKAVVPEIQKSAQYKAGGVIFITWDEGENGSDDILTIAVSNRAKPGYVSMTPFTHDNFLATIEDIFKLPRTGAAVGAQNMMDLFN
jgi:phosphatidylinositol-3-phosphatase